MAPLARLCAAPELGGQLHNVELALQPRVVDWLLVQGAEVADACGDTPMFALLARGVNAIPTLQVLLRHGVSPAGRGGLGRLLAACVQHDQGSRGTEQFGAVMQRSAHYAKGRFAHDFQRSDVLERMSPESARYPRIESGVQRDTGLAGPSTSAGIPAIESGARQRWGQTMTVVQLRDAVNAVGMGCPPVTGRAARFGAATCAPRHLPAFRLPKLARR